MPAIPRHEEKYYIAAKDAPMLEEKLRLALTRDEHADARGEYMIRSLYFDDAFNTAYFDKVAGVQDRDKYRIRIYNLSDRTILLERKRKLGDLIQKDAVRISRKLCDQLVAGDDRGLETLDNRLLRDLFVQMRLRVLRPAVIVDYTRKAFLHPVERVRITFDQDVRSGLSNLDLFSPDVATVPVIDPARVVLEVKYDRYLPDFLPPLLSCVPSEHSAISKYVLCRNLVL